MKFRFPLLAAALAAALAVPSVQAQNPSLMTDPQLPKAQAADHKLVVYQLMTRLFGNKTNTNQFYGTAQTNGVGKMNDIDERALKAIKELGVTHLWYTGIIEHATMTDHSAHGIAPDDPDVVKGRAGSPYAIKDYYDVNPDLAVNVPRRMQEFEALLKRTHKQGLKLLIDFVPNHVARSYRSDAKPAGVKDLGEDDDKSLAFSPQNNFYYLPGTSFVVPHDYHLPPGVEVPGKDGKFDESPAKATGNDQFTHAPSINEWFETVKLNYGVDYQQGRRPHFDPVPSTWLKMRDILLFWAGKGVDGFRCDMAEMVPVEFWHWCIGQVRQQFPKVIFVAEIYNPAQYRNYIDQGRFDYLYDKVGLYDTLKSLVQGRAWANDITKDWQQLQGINHRMLRFLENHDEQRIASPHFAGDARTGVPMMTVTATLGSGPVMLYFGQEVGEPGAGHEGFSGEDGRTTIFDYWGVPYHQQWMNGGKFDGGLLSPGQKALRKFYADLLTLCRKHEALRSGGLYDLQSANAQGRAQGYADRHLYAFVRFTEGEKLLIVANFDRHHAKQFTLQLPDAAWQAMQAMPDRAHTFTDLLEVAPMLTGDQSQGRQVLPYQAGSKALSLQLPPLGVRIFHIEQK